MAQIDWSQGPKPSRRFIHVVRQRPGLLLGVICLMVACAIALVGGVAAGGGEVYISRDDASDLEPDRSRSTSSEEAADDASSEAEPESSRGDGPLSDESEIQEVVVDVTGAVVAPTVARLPAGSRVDDAVLAAVIVHPAGDEVVHTAHLGGDDLGQVFGWMDQHGRAVGEGKMLCTHDVDSFDCSGPYSSAAERFRL